MTRSIVGNRRRMLRLEPLEDRRLLSVGEWSVVSGDVLVGLKGNTRLSDVAPAVELIDWPDSLGPVSAENAELVYSIPDSEGGFLTVVHVHLASDTTVNDAIASLEPLQGVEFAEPNVRYSGDPAHAAPSEPGDQYYETEDGQYYHELIGTPAAWGEVQDQSGNPDDWGGEGVIIAVLDSDFGIRHPELVPNIWLNEAEIPPTFRDMLVDVDGDGRISFADLRDAANLAQVDSSVYMGNPDMLYSLLIGTEGSGDPQWVNKVDDDGYFLNPQGYDLADGAAMIDDLIGWNFDDDSPFLPGTWDVTGGDGHGDLVAGVAAAVTGDGAGIAGVAGNATIMPLRISTRQENDHHVTSRSAAYVYAADHGAHIALSAWGGMPDLPEPWESPTKSHFQTYRRALDYAYDAGMLLINSAGNDASDADDLLADEDSQLVNVDLRYPQTLYVANTDPADRKAETSNWGTGIDISAPGEGILTTSDSGEYVEKSGEESGTSFSAAIVAGTAALVWSMYTDQPRNAETRDEVAALLVGTAENIDAENYVYHDYFDELDGFGQVIRTHLRTTRLHGMLGSGRVDAAAAVGAAVGTLAPPWIDGILETSTGLTEDTTHLTVHLNSVFAGPTYDAGELTAASPVDDSDNWELVYAGDDGLLDTGDDEQIALTLDFRNPTYTSTGGYRIGMNDLDFSFPPLAEGYYRLTAHAKSTEHPNGLRDPFGTALDGDHDGTIEPDDDDWVRDFHVGTRNNITITANDDPQNGQAAGDGTADSFLLKANEAAPEYLDIFINGTDPDNRAGSYLMMEIGTLTINGSTDADTVTIEHLPLGREIGGDVTINGGPSDNDTVNLYGSPLKDTLRAYDDTATLDVAGELTLTANNFQTVNAYGHDGTEEAGGDTAHLYYGGPSHNVGYFSSSEPGPAVLQEHAAPGSDWINSAFSFDSVFVYENGIEPEASVHAYYDIFHVDPYKVYFWDEWRDGEWEDDPYVDGNPMSRWLNAYGVRQSDFPNYQRQAVVQANHLSSGGVSLYTEDLILAGGATLEVWGGLTVGSATPVGRLIVEDATLELHRNFNYSREVFGDLELDARSTYEFEFGEYEDNVGDLADLAVQAATLAGTLVPRGTKRLYNAGPANWDFITADTADSLTGTFDSVPEVGEHLGCGLTYTSVTTSTTAATLLASQHNSGDANLDNAFDAVDLQQILAARKTAGGWIDGDFDGDGDVDVFDLVPGWDPLNPVYPYPSSPIGTLPDYLIQQNQIGQAKGHDGIADLVVDPGGFLRIFPDGVDVTGFIITSKNSIFSPPTPEQDPPFYIEGRYMADEWDPVPFIQFTTKEISANINFSVNVPFDFVDADDNRLRMITRDLTTPADPPDPFSGLFDDLTFAYTTSDSPGWHYGTLAAGSLNDLGVSVPMEWTGAAGTNSWHDSANWANPASNPPIVPPFIGAVPDLYTDVKDL